MAKIVRNQIYRCEKCGNVIEIVDAKGPVPFCCGQEMDLYEENTLDAAKEKHVPVVTRDGDKIEVVVGSVAHPMTEAHLIQWIEVIEGGRVQRVHLSADAAPKAEFQVHGDDFVVRAFCNLHGLWRA